jgi:type II secretory ATPase GspE/PulE/Tfp pilus assembly ATPase PilB-like protein
VLSTIHTTSAAATPIRLVDMGVDAYLVASALSGVVSQRLVRRLCERCAAPDELAGERLAALGYDPDDTHGVLRSVGCSHCGGTGYRGRHAVVEIMEIDDAISSMILRGAGAREIELHAVEHGMTPLTDAAIARVRAGITSLDEYARVIL